MTNAERCLRALGVSLLFLGLIQFLVFTLGLARVALSVPLAWSVIILALAGALFVGREAGRREFRSIRTRDASSAKGALIVWTLLAAALALYLALWVLAYYLPDMSVLEWTVETPTWDTWAYHLPTIQRWQARGYVHWIDPGVIAAKLMNGYAKSVELMGFVLIRAFQNDRLHNCINLPFLPIGSLGIAYLALRLRAPARVAIVAGAAWLLIPLNINQSFTDYVDSGYGACAVALIAVLVHINSPWFAAVGGTALGLAVGAKGHGLELGAFGVGLTMINWLLDLRRQRGPGRTQRLRASLRFFGVALCAAMMSGGFWYLRNWWVMHNPFYPIGLTLGRWTIFPGPSESQTICWAPMPEPLRNLTSYQRLYQVWMQLGNNLIDKDDYIYWPWTIFGVEPRYGGLGFLWPLGGLPAAAFLLILALGVRSRQTRVYVMLLSIGLLTFLFQPMTWLPRYTVWIYALGLPSLAVLIAGRWGNPGRQRSHCAVGGWLRAGLKTFLRCWAIACLLIAILEGSILLDGYYHLYQDCPRLQTAKAVIWRQPWATQNLFTQPNCPAHQLMRHP
jgi:hypothetical protein